MAVFAFIKKNILWLLSAITALSIAVAQYYRTKIERGKRKRAQQSAKATKKAAEIIIKGQGNEAKINNHAKYDGKHFTRGMRK